MTPLARPVDSFDLETSFLEYDTQHRWLLSTCIAGITGTLLVGGFVLGLFGHNAKPQSAQAAIAAPEQVSSPKSPVADKQILAERDLTGGYAYPKITDSELPYSKERTKVLDADIQSAATSSENITTITKTPPPEPVDESFVLASDSTIADELTQRGVSQASAVSPIGCQ